MTNLLFIIYLTFDLNYIYMNILKLNINYN